MYTPFPCPSARSYVFIISLIMLVFAEDVDPRLAHKHDDDDLQCRLCVTNIMECERELVRLYREHGLTEMLLQSAVTLFSRLSDHRVRDNFVQHIRDVFENHVDPEHREYYVKFKDATTATIPQS